MASKTNINLKLLVDKKSKKVLFAEAGKDFVDFLFALLQIPLGTLMGLLVEQGLAGSGSLCKVYNSVRNLDTTYLQPNQDKDSLLRPKTASSSYSHTPPLLQSLVCKKQERGDQLNFFFPNSPRPVFGGLFPNSPQPSAFFFQPSGSVSYGYSGEVGYVKGTVTYMVMDDLTVKPMSTISSITLLNTFAVKDVGSLVEKTVVVDSKRALELMMVAFGSTTVLTVVFLERVPEILVGDA